MREFSLTLLEFPLISIRNCSMIKQVNSHGKAVLEGFIDEEIERNLLFFASGGQWLTLQAGNENGEQKVIFIGLIEQLNVKVTGQLRTVELTLIGGTKLLDLKQQKRSFQDAAMTYETIFQTIQNNYGKMFVNLTQNKAIGQLIVQYAETDWEFFKRLASHFNTSIIPFFQSTGILFSVGVQNNHKPNVLDTSAEFRLEYGFYLSNNLEGQDNSLITIKSREIYDLGELIFYQGKTYYVYEVMSSMANAELLHTYTLRTEAGFSQPKEYNQTLAGVSIDGSILAVSGSMVKVQLHIDSSQNTTSAKWFPYSTVYSSPDGSGWYCMPEHGDRVRLYFPNEREDEAYVISSVHLPPVVNDASQSDASSSTGAAGTKAPPRSNPDNKSLMNKFEKQVELTPTSIIMTNNAGMSIVIDDDTGIHITSNKDITIVSEEDMTIKSHTEDLSLEAEESIELNQGSTSITLKEDIKMSGAKVFLQ